MAEIVFENITKIYKPGNVLAIDNFNLEIRDKEFVVLVGPSGCGKSTLIRMMAGLETITKGKIYMDGLLINEIPAKDRDIAMVFQNYALLPHLTVFENIAFGLRIRKVPKTEIIKRVKEAAEILDIVELLDRKPKSLSGGQKQRVALGRAMVRDAKVFLMDEPLSNLDAKLRTQTRTEIVKLHKRLQTTTIYVTHDQVEAMTMGDKLVVMRDGVIQQAATSEEVYENPENIFVAGFIGSPQMNFIDATIVKDINFYTIFYNNRIKIPEEKGRILEEKGYIGKTITLGIRPENIYVVGKGNMSPNLQKVNLKLDLLERVGVETYIHLKLENKTIIARIESKNTYMINENTEFAFDTSEIHLFDRETEKAIR